MILMVVVWLIAPLVLLALSYGMGLIFALVFRKVLSFVELVVLGFLEIVVVGSVMTGSTQLAKYTAPVVGFASLGAIALCIASYRRYLRFDFSTAAAGGLTYLIFSFPLMMYGKPSWAGWVQLDDNGSWYAIANRLLSAGHSIPAAVLSTYDRVLQVYLGVDAFNYGSANSGQFAYPTGALLPFGILAKVMRVDFAWVFQPFLSFCAALVAMLFVQSLRRKFSTRYLIILGATFASLASTIFSYVMWGGIKEIVLVIPVVYFALKIFSGLGKRISANYAAALLICTAAIYFIGAKTSLVLIIPIALIAILIEVSRRNQRAFLTLFGSSALIAAGLVYSLASGGTLLRLLVPQIKDLGNLYGQLNPLQVIGIWPTRDFRLPAYWTPFTYFAIYVAICFLALGVYKSIKRGDWLMPSLLVSSLLVVSFSYIYAGAWITGKAIAVASPIFLLAVVHGISEIRSSPEIGRTLGLTPLATKVIASGLVFTVISGVVVSDVLTYRNTWLAPYSQTDELRLIGRDFAGQGPTLMPDYSPLGARYFLRDVSAESASELRVHLIPMRDGSEVPRGATADVDLFANSSLDYFNLLVIRKSPRLSRPPLNFSLVRSGENYEVWKKNSTKYTIEKTLTLGDNLHPGTTPTCDQVNTFLANRAPGDRIFTVDRSPTYLVPLTGSDLPAKWSANPNFYGAVNFDGPGEISRNFTIDQDQNYRFWIGGAYPGNLDVRIDGITVYSGHSVFDGNPALTNPIGEARLNAGTHQLTLVYKTPWLEPGSAALSIFGPIFLSAQIAGDSTVRAVKKADIPALCTQNLDWIAIAR